MHDAAMLAESGFLRDLNTYAFSPVGVPLCIYGDPAYPLRIHLQAPFRNTARLTQQMELFNMSMSKVRMSVEWIFGDIINDFKFLDFKKNLKMGLSAVGEMYIVGAILRNCFIRAYIVTSQLNILMFNLQFWKTTYAKYSKCFTFVILHVVHANLWLCS